MIGTQTKTLYTLTQVCTYVMSFDSCEMTCLKTTPILATGRAKKY